LSLEGGIDIGGALSFGRGLPFLGGILRPALGAFSNNAHRAAANEGLDAIGALRLPV
jgi:hypothetical protein